MTDEIINNIKIDKYEVFAPVIGAELTNAMYLAKLVHLQKGSDASSDEIRSEVLSMWGDLSSAIQESAQRNENNQ